jgi:hypothetical protein
MILRWQLSTHIHGTVKKKTDSEIGITQKYIRSGTKWDVYKRPLYFLRRVWWCLSHYHWTLHFRCSVKEMIISLNLAISTAVMAMKLQMVTNAEIFCKNKWIHRVVMIKQRLLTHFPLKKNWKNAHNFTMWTPSMVLSGNSLKCSSC